MTPTYRLYIHTTLFAGLIFIDQFSKYIIRTRGGFYICNQGIAFGIRIYWPIVLLIPIIICLLLFFNHQDTRNKIRANFNPPAGGQNSIFKKLRYFADWLLDFVCSLFLGDWLLRTGIIFVASGAVSNILDRLRFGCVIDFIDLPFWPVFNLADIYITIGAMAIVARSLSKKDKL
ncbi:MAG: signal peptidase II [Parcubacteria group bacterium]